MSKVKNYLVFMAYLSLLVLGVVDTIRSPFYPNILHQWNLTATKGSLFFATASFAALGGNFLGAFLLKKVSAHGLMNLSVMGIGIGFLLIGGSAEFYLVLWSCVFFGIHFGLLNVSQNVVVQKNAALKYRRQIFNGLHTMYGLAALLAPLIASGFLDLGWTWQQSFMLIGAVAASLGLISLVIAWKWKESEPIEVTHTQKARFDSVKAALIATALGLYIMTELSLSTRLPLWVQETSNLSAQTANLYLALFFGGLFLSRLMFTFVSFASLSNQKILGFSAALGLCCYALGLLIHPVIAACAGLFMGPFFPVILDEMSLCFHHQASQVIGWSITLGSIMVVTMHFSVGVLSDHFGIQNALWVGPLGFTLVLSTLFLASRRSALP